MAEPADPAPRPGRIVAVANLKGGTGKSTIAVNLACLAAAASGPVLLVDADPQGTAAAWLEPAERPAGLEVEAWPVPDDPTLWADRLFAAAAGFGRIVVDMPPQPGPGFEAVLRLADVLVIPVTPSAIDLRATAQTLRRIEAVRRARDGRPACLLVPNRVDRRTAIGRAIQRALRDLDIEVAPPVAQRSAHPMAFAARQWIGAHAPSSAAHRELAAVAARVERRLEAAPANDYVPMRAGRLFEDELVSSDDLVLTAAPGEPAVVDPAPLPAGPIKDSEAGRIGHTVSAGAERAAGPRPGWLASLLASLRLIGVSNRL